MRRRVRTRPYGCVTFFLDNTNPPGFAPSLRAFEFDVRHMLECAEFPRQGATKDEEWMPVVGAQGWACITGDRRILVTEPLPRIRRESKLTTFFMPKGYTTQPLWPQYQLLVKCWLDIKANAERARAGDCFEVQQNGKVNLFVPKH